VLAGAAAQYLLLAAEFVAVTQVLVYIGAVMVLFLFGVMLTRAKLGHDAELNNKNGRARRPVALLLLGVMAYVLIDGFERHQASSPVATAPHPGSTSRLSDKIFSAVPAAVLGAVVRAARRRHRRHRAGPEGLRSRC
jgi:NADH-quinone oxidoreductase subunit J